MSAPKMLEPVNAHMFGVGDSYTETRALNRRALVTLAVECPDFAEQVLRRAVQQGMLEALPAYWVWRAEALQTVGTQWGWEAAIACRRHAWLLSEGLPVDLVDELDAFAGEVV